MIKNKLKSINGNRAKIFLNNPFYTFCLVTMIGMFIYVEVIIKK